MVYQLWILFPLPVVEVSTGAVRKRVVLPDGTTCTTVGAGSHADGAWAQGHGHGLGQGQGPGLVLTTEEIKYVICSTVCWMFVREEIGGVGKVNRKGDRWRIRG